MRRLTLLALVLLSGCSAAALKVLETIDTRPTARVVDTRLEDIGLERLTLGLDVEVTNPFTFDLPLAELVFTLQTGGRAFLDGSTDVGGVVPAGGSRIVPLPIGVDYLGMMEVAERVRPGKVVPYTASLSLQAMVGETPVTVPVRHEGELPIPAVPSIDVQRLEWDQISLDAIRGSLVLGMGNPNEFGFTVAGLDYTLSLAGRRVATASELPALALEPAARGTLRLPLAVSPQEAGLALLDAVRKDTTSFELAGRIHLDTPFGPVELPFERSGTAPQTP